MSASLRKPSQLRPPAQKLSQSIPTLKTSHFRTAHENRVNFDPYVKTKSLSTHRLKPSNFWPTLKTEVDFDPRTKKKSSSISTLKPRQLQTKLISTPSLKLSQFRSPLLYQVYFDGPTQNLVDFDPDAKKKEFFDRYTKTKSMPIHIEMNHFRQTTQQPNQFHPTVVKSILMVRHKT